jgi:hypothetical protein
LHFSSVYVKRVSYPSIFCSNHKHSTWIICVKLNLIDYTKHDRYYALINFSMTEHKLFIHVDAFLTLLFLCCYSNQSAFLIPDFLLLNYHGAFL